MRIRDIVIAVAGRIAKYAIVARSTSTGHSCAVESPAHDTDEPDSQEPARRMQDFGLRSVPPVGSECAVIRSRGGASNAIIVATEHLGHGPTDLQEGETSLFCKAENTVIKLNATGSIIVNAKNQETITLQANGAMIQIEDDGDITVIPATGKQVRLGDGLDANLLAVALYPVLKTWSDALVSTFNAHKHTETGGITMTPDLVATTLPVNCASANVVVKKT